MKSLLSLSLVISLVLPSFKVQAQEETTILRTATGNLEGTICLPELVLNPPVVLIIAGSGPTDRNGNQEELQNNSLKFLAEELRKNGIASLRFDKRGIGQSSDVNKDEYEMRFETFSNDVKAWIDLLYADKRFSRIIVAGHSEGSLLGLIASENNKKVKAYISISGAGRPIDEVIKEQLQNVPPDVREQMYGMLDKLKKGDTLGNVPPIFYSLFRPSIQPYMISWMKYDPQKEIKKIKVPVLIVQGTTDLQVKEKDALALAKGQPKAQLKLITNMNHVLKDCESLDKEVQKKIYGDPDLPLNKELVKIIVNFITPPAN
ncbi:MAG: alpha/beta hydrolase [bacterium]|nr:alpha/beta hydrolase [bacterium]